jgi:putative ABC transport system permease protein
LHDFIHAYSTKIGLSVYVIICPITKPKQIKQIEKQRSKPCVNQSLTYMLKNYLIVSFRNLLRNKVFSIINIVGLAMGISACLIIYLIVRFELSFDTFHPDRGRIYRVYSQFSGTFEAKNAGVPAPLPFFISDEMTGVEKLTAFHTFSAQVEIMEKGKKIDWQTDIALIQPSYFDLFRSYKWIAGSPEYSLNSPFQVVLTESRAKLYFNSSRVTEILGKVIRYNDSLEVRVSGIVKDLSGPTDLIFNDFISFSTIQHSWLKKTIDVENWGNTSSSSQVFIQLSPGTTPQKIKAQLQAAEKKYVDFNKGIAWRIGFHLQPLADLHFNADLEIFDRSRAAAHLPTLQILTVLALFILLIAAINFINLITAQALGRAKEVGVRKVLGSTRTELIRQFLCETLLITLLAVGVAVFFTDISLVHFQEFIPKGVVFQLSDSFTILFLIATILAVSLLSGLYPAFVLSSFTPVVVLKSQSITNAGQTRTAYLRKSLIVFQFAFAQILIVGTLIMSWQIDFMLNKDMGFTQDAIITFYTPGDQPERRLVLKQELSKFPGIKTISMHQAPPAISGYSTDILEYNNGKESLKYNVHLRGGDTAYIHLYQIPLLAGRNLHTSDSLREYLINETYTAKLGFLHPADAIGKMLRTGNSYYPIVGVVKDFHIQSLHNPIQPVAIMNATQNLYAFSLQLATQDKQAKDFQAILQEINRVWDKLYMGEKFSYTFMDESIARFYASEQRSAKLVRTATGIAIFISCLGLFGLATYTAQTRTKEIGIRKVLGASVSNIVALLSKDFIRLVVLANLIAWPIAWWLVHVWLDRFAYRIEVPVLLFLGSGLVALIIALATVSYQAIKVAVTNPVKSLRNE